MDNRKYRKLFGDLPRFETERIVLRKIQPDDIYFMYDYASMEELSRYLLWTPHLNIDETRGHIEFLQKEYRKGRCTDWGVASKETGALIGTCGFSHIDTHNNRAEIGYVLSPRFWKRGLMREAVLKVFEIGFNELGLNRIEARILEGNSASVALATSVGMKYEGTLHKALLVKGEYKSFSYYGITAADYFA